MRTYLPCRLTTFMILLTACIAFAASVNTTRAEVEISEAEYESRDHFKIVTGSTTYYFDKTGGGFSRVLDRDGNDWVSFHKDPLKEFPASAAAGYRGIPNLLYGASNPDAGAGHPGFDLCESKRIGDNTIRSNTLNGKWSWEWAFTDQYATFTVTQVDESHPYWFLYEGPVGGKWSPKTYFFGTDLAGPRRDLPDISNQIFGRFQWAYFGDDANANVLVAAQLQSDEIDDTLWYLGDSPANLDSNDGMVVFGFGRGPKSQPLLRGAGRQFRIGFLTKPSRVDALLDPMTTLHQTVIKTAKAWLADKPVHIASAQRDSVSVRNATLFGDMECFRVETPTATYLYGKQGAGFASILDVEGNDWISYQHGNKAAGEYRGLPKSGQPTKFFHCGYGFGQYTNENPYVSEVTQQLPGHVRIHSETRDGKFACDWDFYATHATMTLTKIGQEKYWFLYEGTPGGKLESDRDYVVRPGNRKTFLNDPWLDNVPWVYFGASESKSSFFLIDHQNDPGPESYVSWPYTKDSAGSFHDMTVFGFGRPGWQDPAQHTPPLEVLPARFSIGFAETRDYTEVETAITKITNKVAAEKIAKQWRGPQPPEGRDWPAGAHFFHRTWFQMGGEFSNPKTNNRFRVNDAYAATHPNFHHRLEPKENGMMLIPMNHSVPTIEAARLVLELWGGHPHTSNRRFTVNGRTTYPIDVPVDDQCTQVYRSIPLKITDLVRGPNAIQFAVDGDQTFWGHFIVEEAAIETLLPESNEVVQDWNAVSPTNPVVLVNDSQPELFLLSLDMSQQASKMIARVHYYAKYEGFDENGDGNTNDWHGMTKRKEPLGHLGTSDEAPYSVQWDTSMVVAQQGVQVRAVIELVNSETLVSNEQRLKAENNRYWKAESTYLQTEPTKEFSIVHPPEVEVVRIPSEKHSVPFWSRANQRRKCEFTVPKKGAKLERAQLSIVVWDGGAGEVKEYFKFNGHPLSIAADAQHDVLYSQVPMDPSWISAESNRIDLHSDTEHHGPSLILRYRK
jgi:hypothetical protein